MTAEYVEAHVYRCALCGRPVVLAAGNVVRVSCADCNATTGADSPASWLAQMRGEGEG